MVPNFKHHSASSINNFINNRYTWYLKKVRGINFPGNPNMHRGSAVEAGINHWMQDQKGDVQEAIRVANEYFKEKTTGMMVMPDMRASIAVCVNAGISSVIKNYGTDHPVQQKKIELKLEGLKYPIVGYLDWLYDGKRLVVDNKVTGKSPSALTQEYCLQGAVYHAATGYDVQFHYIVPLAKECKTKVIPVTQQDINFGLQLAKAAGMAIEKILEMELPFEDVNALFFGNPSASWSDDEKRIVMKEMFGYLEEERK